VIDLSAVEFVDVDPYMPWSWSPAFMQAVVDAVQAQAEQTDHPLERGMLAAVLELLERLVQVRLAARLRTLDAVLTEDGKRIEGPS
jgi:hypothetical protein